MKFLTKHNKQVILEIINYSMFTTHPTHLPIAPTLRHLQFLQSPFFIGKTWVKYLTSTVLVESCHFGMYLFSMNLQPQYVASVKSK